MTSAYDLYQQGWRHLRDGYASTLEDEAAESYRLAFHAAVARRFRRYASLVADLEP